MVFGATLSAQASSFDCAKAQGRVERRICTDVELSQLDDELATAYAASVQDGKDIDGIWKDQLRWMHRRNACTTTECVRTAYLERIQLLSVLRDKKGIRHGRWAYRLGEDKQICNALLSRLNRFDRDEDTVTPCSDAVIASYPGFETPQWEELDLKAQKDLLSKIVKYNGEGGPARNFGLVDPQRPVRSDSEYGREVATRIEAGVRVRVLRMNLVSHYKTPAGETLTAAPQSQVMVQLYSPLTGDARKSYCVGKPKPRQVNSLASTYLFSSDLTAPSAIVDPATYGTMTDHDVMLLAGQPILVGTESLYQDGAAGLELVCSFRFLKVER